ncbi:hypothetical protein GGR52DRAFT_573793 [Hypoxylon sp. FL1284]|nr:hypothetical protein GGR52DRAFT_573793 [Hypoxylon sp. FL1284]
MKKPTNTPEFNGRKHAALRGHPTVHVSAEQWNNVNRSIVKTVDSILARNITLDSLGPDYWEIDEGYGIALVAEIRRAIKETCKLSDTRLQGKIRRMASDVSHEEFRFPCEGGGVWFRFKMTDLQKAMEPTNKQESDDSPTADIDQNEIVEDKEEPANREDGLLK